MTAQPLNPHPAVCGDVAPDEPPIRGEAAEGEAHANPQNTPQFLKIMHGQPRCSYLGRYEKV